MPFTFNGIGTALSGYSAPIRWSKPSFFGGQRPDHDAMECFVVFFLPVIPLRTVHTFGWSGSRYKVLPLRRSGRMLLHTFLRPLGILLSGVGIVMLGIVALTSITDGLGRGTPIMAALSVAVGAIGFGLLRWLRSRDARTRDIRLVIGPHEAGSSDPAQWSAEVLKNVKEMRLSDAQTALQGGQYGLAMMTARIAAARGEPEAEQVTDEILSHPNVQSALAALRREPWRRAELLQA